jgi:hypothetical protein
MLPSGQRYIGENTGGERYVVDAFRRTCRRAISLEADQRIAHHLPGLAFRDANDEGMVAGYSERPGPVAAVAEGVGIKVEYTALPRFSLYISFPR